MSGRGEIGDARSYALRVSFFYAAVFLIYGFNVPFLPVWLGWRGLTDGEIAIVTALPFFARLFVTPVVAVAADRTGDHRRFIIVLAWIGLLAAFALNQMDGFWPILLVSLPFALVTMTIMPLTETVAVTGVRRHGLDYGRMRLWGSLTFIVIGLGGGSLISWTGAWSIVPVLIAGAAMTALAAHLLPNTSAGETKGAHFSWGDLHQLLRSPIFLVFLFASGAVQASHATFYTFGTLHWKSQGLSAAWCGALWAVAVFSEVVLFAYSSAVLRRIGPAVLLLTGGAAGLLRWCVMSFDPPLAVLFPLQMLHAATYGATHLGAVHFIHRAVPQAAAGTAQALYATMAAGVMMGAATLACGPLYAAFGAYAYLAMAVVAAAGLLAAFLVWLRWSGDSLWSSPAVVAGLNRQPHKAVS